MSIKVSQNNNNVLFGKLTNFVKNQLKVLKEIIKGNTVVIRWPVTNPTENIKVSDAEINPMKFNGGPPIFSEHKPGNETTGHDIHPNYASVLETA